MSKYISVSVLTLVFLAAGVAQAAVCPDSTPPIIVAPAAASAKCQAAIAKASTTFVKIKVKVRGKCITKGGPLDCPNAKDDGKIAKIVGKMADKITKACTEAEITGLSNSYSVGAAGGVDGAAVASCVLGQSNVEAKLIVGHSYGVANDWFSANKDRGKCQKELGKGGSKFVRGALKAINSCVAKATKDGIAGDLAPRCVGSFSAGAYVPPTDAKAASKITGAITKAEAGIDKKCGMLSTLDIESTFACPNATTVDELKSCVVCDNWSALLSIVAAQYAEAGTYVANAVDAIQTAVDAASSGDKLLIGSGTYNEDVLIPRPTCGATAPNPGDPCTTDADCGGGAGSCEPSQADGLQIVGCGGASDDRPKIEPFVGSAGNGFDANATDGLLFQSLEVNGWPSDGIFVADAQGISFRDIKGDGQFTSTYAVFPVRSDNVLVEVSDVTQVIDAGIYVGQSTNIVARYNRVQNGVAGLEIENCDFSQVYSNFMKGNTAGILVFLDSGVLPVQAHTDHKVHHNMVTDNNQESNGIAIPGSTVATIPTGTGILTFSTDDGDFHHNRVTNNGSFGFAMLDQAAINALSAPAVPFPTLSADQRTENNLVRNNQFGGNGTAPDTTPPNNTPLSSNIIFVLGEDTPGHGNCFTSNSSSSSIFLTTVECP